MRKRVRLTNNHKRILRVLLNGPWPCDFTRGMIADQSEHRGEYNGHRAIAKLVKLGLVESFTDKATGRDNWRIKRDRFDQPVIWHESHIAEIK